MFHKLAEYWQARQGIKRIERHPVLGIVLTYLRRQNEKPDREGIWAHATEEAKAKLTLTLLGDIERSITSDNPVNGLRHRMFEVMHETAMYQVLVMEPEPTPDPTGLRTFEGITGELKARIPELAQIDEVLREYFYGLNPSPETSDDMWDAVLFHYWKCNAYMNTFNMARFALKDYHDDNSKDWFRPCYTSLCIWHEHQFREKLRMASALSGTSGNDVAMKALGHSLWQQAINSGAKELRLHWEDAWLDIFKEPSPYSSKPA